MMTTQDHIRSATTKDASEIAGLYSYYVKNTVISFELVPPDAQEMQRRIGECINSSFEWLVWEDHGALLGFAYYSRFKERRAYDYACETAIYVRHGFLGKGIGLALYRQLIARLKKSKQAIAVACITVPNEASIGLHEELGFQNCGIIRNAGRKFGTWLDIGYWVLELKNLPEYEPEEMEPAGQDSRSAAQR